MNRPNRAPENPRAKAVPSGVGRGTAGRGGGARTAAAVATRTAGSAGFEALRATSKDAAPGPKFGSASAPEQPARRRSSRIEKLRLASEEAETAAEAKPTAVAQCAPSPPKRKKAALDPAEGPAKRLRTAAVADGRPLLRGESARAPRPLGAAAPREPATAPRPPPRPVHPDLLREQLGRRPGAAFRAAFPGPPAGPGRTPLSDLTASVASDRQRVSWIPQGGDRWDGVPDEGVGCSPPWSLRVPAPLRNPDLSGLTVGEEDDDDDEPCPSPSRKAPSLGTEQQRALGPRPPSRRRDGAPRSGTDSKKRASAAKPPPGGGGGARQRKPPPPRHALGPGGANKAAPAASRAVAPALAADAATNKPRGGTARAPPRQQPQPQGHRGRRGAANSGGRWPADVLAPPTRVPAAKKGPAAGCCEPGSRRAARDDAAAAAARDAENGGTGTGTSGRGGSAGDACADPM
jgi:hypothetical protein